MNPLVFTPNYSPPEGNPEVNDLVTWVDYKNRQIGGRVTKTRGLTFWVKVVGLTNPSPYTIGETYPVDGSQIIDWE